MSEPNPQEPYFRAVRDGDVDPVRQLLDQRPDVLATPPMLTSYLNVAAQFDQVAVMELLVECGADIHATEKFLGGPIHKAASHGAASAVRWLLERGAAVDTGDEDDPCPGLEFAAMDGHLECVRLLVEAGAPLETAGQQALYLARERGYREVAAYLLSVGVPDDEEDTTSPDDATKLAEAGGGLPDLRDHLERKLLGMLEPDAYHDILPGSPNIQILVLDQFGARKALVSEGMSTVAMKGPVPYAEMILYLPADWPLGPNALDDDRYNWPVLWIRRLARFPHEAGGGYDSVVRFDYEEPLSPGTRFTAFLLLAGFGEHGSYVRSDGETVQHYTILPIYPEENDLAEREGIPSLMRLFAQHSVSPVLSQDRQCVVHGR